MNRNRGIWSVVVCLSFFITVSTATHAWFGEDLWEGVKDTASAVGDAFKAAWEELEETGGDVVAWFENRYAELMTSGCSDRDAVGITASCFGDYTFSRLHGGMRFAKKASDEAWRYNMGSSSSYSPHAFIKSNIHQFYSGSSEAVQDAFFWKDEGTANASNMASGLGAPAPVIIWSNAYDNYWLNNSFASMLIHEAQHSHYGSHTCSSAADNDENGPYGTQIRFLFYNSLGYGPEDTDGVEEALKDGVIAMHQEHALQVGINKSYSICDQSARDRLLQLVTSGSSVVEKNFCSGGICTDAIPAEGPGSCRYGEYDNGVRWITHWQWKDDTKSYIAEYACHEPGYKGTQEYILRTPSRYKSFEFSGDTAPSVNGSCYFEGKSRLWVLYNQTKGTSSSAASGTTGYYECKDMPPSQEYIRVDHAYPLYCWTQGKNWPECNYVHEITAGQCILPSNQLGTYYFSKVEYQFKSDYSGAYQPVSKATYRCGVRQPSPAQVVRRFRYDLTDDYNSQSVACFGQPYSEQTKDCFHKPLPPASAGPCYVAVTGCKDPVESTYFRVQTKKYDWHYEGVYECKQKDTFCNDTLQAPELEKALQPLTPDLIDPYSEFNTVTFGTMLPSTTPTDTYTYSYTTSTSTGTSSQTIFTDTMPTKDTTSFGSTTSVGTVTKGVMIK